MAIKEYVHGGGKDYQLWGNVGRLVMDRKIQQRMGNCISSEPGDVWWVSLTHKSETRGFASARPMKNGSLYLRYFYVVEQGSLALAEETLVRKAINYAKGQGMPLVYTYWLKHSDLLPRLGFAPRENKRGQFCRWELSVEQEDAQ